MWQRISFYYQIEYVESNLQETLFKFSKAFSSLVGEDVEFNQDTKLDESTFSFQRVNLPNLKKDDGEEIVTQEVENMVATAEEMIKSAEEGNYIKAGIVFFKQIIASTKVIFNTRPGEGKKPKNKKITWLMSQALLQVMK